MSVRKKFRVFRTWCPQPKSPVSMNYAKLSTPILASLLLIEIAVLLIAPLTYAALFLPKTIATDRVLPDQTFPLTDTQIKAAWPNIPTAKEVVNGSLGYSLIDSNMPGFDEVKNYT